MLDDPWASTISPTHAFDIQVSSRRNLSAIASVGPETNLPLQKTHTPYLVIQPLHSKRWEWVLFAGYAVITL